MSTKLNILNNGNKPTFVINDRNESTDFTLGTDKKQHLVSSWHAFDETSLSNHKYILFQMGDLGVTKVTCHNPK